ncbi:hypothetical protein [Streptomyces acidicola]|uniref:hypothetical protein n=1 Tax=Streptomyces acidicola TaxID=2596892 RepID=UPI0034487AE4
MPADEETRGTAVGESRARSGPRHAAPKKPLLTRIQVPAGKAIAMAAMPTAVLMGMGFTSTLARADDKPAATRVDDEPVAKSLEAQADDYKDCVDALEAAEKDKDASATPSPSASTTDSASDDKDGQDDKGGKEEQSSSGKDSSGSGTSGGDSSSDSGSGDEAEPAPSPSTSAPAGSSDQDTSTTSPSPSEGGGNVLDAIGGAIKDAFTPGEKQSADAEAKPSPSASAAEDAADAVKDTTDKVAGAAEDAKDTVEDTVKDVTDAASKDTEDTSDTEEKAEKEAKEEAADEDAATPSPSASATTDPEDCPAATDEEGGVEPGIPPLADDPWYLEASSLLLKGADYQGIVKVKTANGSVKEVLKYVISDGTDIGDLHQLVKDKQAGKTYHVQAGKGTTSTIRDGQTVMYTESISGNLLGLIPITFDPEHPPPLNIPLIYFTDVTVVQAAQFGGTLTIPRMHQYITD